MKREAYERQDGVCPVCKKNLLSPKWKRIILILGTMAEELSLKIVRCCVRKIIELSLGNRISAVY